MQHTCTQCDKSFEHSQEDMDFLAKIARNASVPNLPVPKLCVDCREQRRCSAYNQRTLYQRKCDATNKEILSMYSSDKPFPVYNQEYWWGDQWDPMQYGQEFDFNKPFFDQYIELSAKVPRANLFTAYKQDENCTYTNHAGRNRNCFLIFDSDDSWDCLYGYSLNSCKSCVDCMRTRQCELCYECVDSQNLYNSIFCQNSVHCQDSAFLRNCIGCKNCMFCANLHQKEYCIFNEQLTKEEYEKRRQELHLNSAKVLEQAVIRFEEFAKQFPRRYRQDVQAEGCTGDYLTNCKDAHYCFDSRDLFECRYVFQVFMKTVTSMDCQEVGDGVESCYNCCTVGYNAHGIICSDKCLDQVHNLTYSVHCHQSSNLFGCVSLRKKEFCILNRQYTKEEYTELLPKIISHMEETGEWGEFFPPKVGTFAYNESVAMDRFPLTKDQAIAGGWTWREDLPYTIGKETASWDSISDTIDQIDESIVEQILACKETKKNYRITKQEIEFYKKMKLPLPRLHPDERHDRRMAKRNPWKLWDRKCSKCEEGIQTSFAPERQDKVYCETCYHKEVYG